MAVGIITPFVWGEGGEKLTPEEVARRRKMLEALTGKTDTSPVGHWTQGLARVTDAIGDVLQDRRLDAAETKNSETNSDLISRLLAGTGAPAGLPTAAATSGVAGELAATSPAVTAGAPIDLTGNEVFSGFIDTVKQGGVTNPYALAAIAATGKAESGFSPGNVNRTWSDPSESGQPGTAGGIMSWRGPRYQALTATGDLSPQGQAKFFLQENPQLIAALNNAQSLEEAQTLMNNAWKFAGYDRPGGEAARRLSLASSFLPNFQGQSEVAALTPEAAIEAVAPGSGMVDPAAAAPAFDTGRFGDPMNLAEMPPSAAQLPGALMDQGASYAPTAPALPPPTTVQDRPVASVAQALTAPVEVAQAGEGYFPPPPAPPSAQGINPAIIEALSSPYADEQTKRIAGLLLGQELERQKAANDPMTALDMDYKRAQIQKMQGEIAKGPNGDESFFGNPVAIQNPDGSISYGQIGNKGSFKPIQLGEGQSFAPPTRNIDTGTEIVIVDQAGNVISRTPKENFKEAYDSGAGAAAAKADAETQSEYKSIKSKMPGLYGVVDRLEELAAEATYTTAGKVLDTARSQLGMTPRDAAVSRAEYTAIVDNQILPLLRDTFGAQFTAEEGQRLARTLGDPDKSPTEKSALLRAFIAQKERDIAALENRLGGDDAAPKSGRRLRYNPQTGKLE